MEELLEKMMEADELAKKVKSIKKEIPSTPSSFARKLMATTEVDLNLLRSIGAKECSFFTEVGVVTCSFIDGTVLISVDGLYNNYIVPYKGKLVTSSAATFIFEETADHIGGYDIKVVISLGSNNKIRLEEFAVENNA